MKYSLEEVTNNPGLWSTTDPVRPELDSSFKTQKGRGVYGLKAADGDFKSFLCYARVNKVPASVKQLDEFTDETGSIIIPYTVWSLERGAGREIIEQVLALCKSNSTVERVVTLSPLTRMARRFHLKNGAKELRMNSTTVNFEYEISGD